MTLIALARVCRPVKKTCVHARARVMDRPRVAVTNVCVCVSMMCHAVYDIRVCIYIYVKSRRCRGLNLSGKWEIASVDNVTAMLMERRAALCIFHRRYVALRILLLMIHRAVYLFIILIYV